MKLSISQPGYLPWGGYFDRILKSDLHVCLDHVQFEKNSTTNRNKIKTAQGWTWLTIPVKTKGQFQNCPIAALETDDTQKWAKKHWQSIVSSYGRTPHYADHKDFFETFFTHPYTKLIDVLDESNRYFIDYLGITTPVIKSSTLPLTQHKSDLVLELCQKLGATTYISGALGRDYLQREDFEKNNIAVVFHDYISPTYPQAFGDFEKNMSILDIVMNCGTNSLEILQNPISCLKTE